MDNNGLSWAFGAPDMGHAPVLSPKNTSFYIDGFNLYYSILEFCDNKIQTKHGKLAHDNNCNIKTCSASKYKWINLYKLSQRILSNHDFGLEYLKSVKLFTSKQAIDSDKFQRQEIFEKVQKYNGVEIIYGRFDKNKGNKQEKETDMNIAINIIEDVLFNNVQRVVLISNDSDFVPLIHFLKRRCKNLEIILYTPPNRPTVFQLKEAMCRFYDVNIEKLNKKRIDNRDIKIYKLSRELILQCKMPQEITINEKILSNPYE